MKNFPLPYLPVALALVFLSAPALTRAQETTVVQPTQTQTTVTTTDPEQTKTTQTTVTTVPTQPAPAVAPAPIVLAQPGQHVAEIELVVTHGSVQAYFGHAPRGEKFGIGNAEIRIKLPSTATVTKLASRDKDSAGATKVTVDNPWHVTVPFNESGRYVFNIVEWDDDPAVAVAMVKVDGVLKFEGQGHADDFRDWPQKAYGEGVHKTGSREIAFDVD